VTKRAALAMVSLFGAVCSIASPVGASSRRPAEVDRSGVLRWTDSDEEVSLFRANYVAPFACTYRALAMSGRLAKGPPTPIWVTSRALASTGSDFTSGTAN